MLLWMVLENAVFWLQTKKGCFYSACGTSTMTPVNFAPLALVKAHGLWKRPSLDFVETNVNVTANCDPGFWYPEASRHLFDIF